MKSSVQKIYCGQCKYHSEDDYAGQWCNHYNNPEIPYVGEYGFISGETHHSVPCKRKNPHHDCTDFVQKSLVPIVQIFKNIFRAII